MWMDCTLPHRSEIFVCACSAGDPSGEANGGAAGGRRRDGGGMRCRWHCLCRRQHAGWSAVLGMPPPRYMHTRTADGISLLPPCLQVAYPEVQEMAARLAAEEFGPLAGADVQGCVGVLVCICVWCVCGYVWCVGVCGVWACGGWVGGVGGEGICCAAGTAVKVESLPLPESHWRLLPPPLLFSSPPPPLPLSLLLLSSLHRFHLSPLSNPSQTVCAATRFAGGPVSSWAGAANTPLCCWH